MTDLRTTDQAVPSLVRGGRPAPPPAAGTGPLAWFDSWVRSSPDAPAVVSGAGAWSYRELDRTAGHLVEALTGHVDAGKLVGVRLDRSPELVAAAVALARMKATYLPLGRDPGPARMRSLTEDADIDCVLIGADTPPPPGFRGYPCAGLGLAVARRIDGSGTRLSDAFYAVTTSGSTGKPKIVLVPEAALANLVAWYCDDLGFGADSRVSLLVEPVFDPHLKELWAALSSGGALYVAPGEARGSVAELVGWWRAAGITHCILPTPLADLVFSRPWPSGLSLRHVSVGGDRMRVPPPPGCTATVHNMYGPAEATVVTTSFPVTRRPAENGAAIPIGGPIPGVTVFVTDQAGDVVPRGQAGELRVGGANLATGYLDPAQTHARFVPPPPGRHGVDRVYRTGDKVRMRPDGLLEFLGRLDGQVKVSGVRIEPGEVESALEAHESVRQAVVVAVGTPDGSGATRLVAFVRTVDGAPADPTAILDAARARVLSPTVPLQIRFVDDFPLTANGKIDHRRLAGDAAPAPEPAADQTGGAEPAALLLATCRRLLDRPGLALSDNFAEAGGTSLNAAQLLVTIESTYGIHIRAAELLRQPDLRAMADLVATRRETVAAR